MTHTNYSMIPASGLEAIYQRLRGIELEQWGPDGIRYVCVLLWEDIGYRYLCNSFGVREWVRWSRSSGDFWDLFLGGCRDDRITGFSDREEMLTYLTEKAGALAHEDSQHGLNVFLWNRYASHTLAKEIAEHSYAADSVRPWSFVGPIELIAVGARRGRFREIQMDWGSLRAAIIRPAQLPEAIADYTEAHISLDGDAIPPEFPTPGSFEDEVMPELKQALKKSVPLLARLLAKANGLP